MKSQFSASLATELPLTYARSLVLLLAFKRRTGLGVDWRP